jgi:hypothetical protein
VTDRALDALAEMEDRFESRFAEMEERIADLEEELEHERDRRRRAERAAAEAERQLTEELTRVDGVAEGAVLSAGKNRDRVQELQERELEKGAQLKTENLPDPSELNTSTEHAEKLTREDGTEVLKLPGVEDDLAGTEAEIAVAMDDLLPIQRLSRLPDEMTEEQIGEKTNLERALWLWENRDHYMNKGSAGVDRYIDSGELQTVLSAKEDGLQPSSETAKRVMSFFVDWTNDRTYTKKERKPNGHKEHRLVIPEDAEIPGERSSLADDGTANTVVSG